MDELTAQLERRVLEPVRNPDGYERYAVPAVDGVLLYGPPDAGKTSLAQSLAAELNRPIVELSVGRFHQEASMSQPTARPIFSRMPGRSPRAYSYWMISTNSRPRPVAQETLDE